MDKFKYIILSDNENYTSKQRTIGISSELEKLSGSTDNKTTKLCISFIENYSKPKEFALQGLLEYKILVNKGFNATNLLEYLGSKVTNEEKEALFITLTKAAKREEPYTDGRLMLLELIPPNTEIHNYQYMLDNGWIEIIP